MHTNFPMSHSREAKVRPSILRHKETSFTLPSTLKSRMCLEGVVEERGDSKTSWVAGRVPGTVPDAAGRSRPVDTKLGRPGRNTVTHNEVEDDTVDKCKGRSASRVDRHPYFRSRSGSGFIKYPDPSFLLPENRRRETDRFPQ